MHIKQTFEVVSANVRGSFKMSDNKFQTDGPATEKTCQPSMHATKYQT